MIHAIRCDQPGFKTVKFFEGLNVVLAERSELATDKRFQKRPRQNHTDRYHPFLSGR
jgi:uncharacterized protein YydD (DUF2326 family)